jgi:hypothetical protein
MRRLKSGRMLFAVVAAATALVGVDAGQSGAVAKAATQSVELTSDAPVTVVASGLNSPRHLGWGPHGHLLVAEAGTPGGECSSTDLFTMICYGLTGSISDISSGTPVRIVTGLPTYINNGQVVGANGLAYVDGQLYTMAPASPLGIPAWVSKDLSDTLKKKAGALFNVTDGSSSVVANPGKVDYQWVVDNHPEIVNSYFDTNPYVLKPKPGGGFYLVDAGANTLGSVDENGKVRVLAFIPSTPAGPEAVPTCVDVGPDGAVYVGEFTGNPNSSTAANVYRYDPASGSLAVWQSGFSTVSGCGFGANGDFYVTEFDTTGVPPAGNPDGVVIQINKDDGTRTVLGAGKLFAPNGFLAGPDGSIYVTNNAIWFPFGTTDRWNEGEVVKIG